MFTGTLIYSILFYGAVLIVTILGILYLVRLWRPAIDSLAKAAQEGKPISSITIRLIKTVVVIVLFIVVVTLGWNLKQSVTTTMSDYKSPAEIYEQKKVQESQLPEKQVLDKVRIEQKERAEVKPHEDAFKSFEDSMKREAEKIKERSLGGAEKK